MVSPWLQQESDLGHRRGLAVHSVPTRHRAPVDGFTGAPRRGQPYDYYCQYTENHQAQKQLLLALEGGVLYGWVRLSRLISV